MLITCMQFWKHHGILLASPQPFPSSGVTVDYREPRRSLGLLSSVHRLIFGRGRKRFPGIHSGDPRVEPLSALMAAQAWGDLYDTGVCGGLLKCWCRRDVQETTQSFPKEPDPQQVRNRDAPSVAEQLGGPILRLQSEHRFESRQGDSKAWCKAIRLGRWLVWR